MAFIKPKNRLYHYCSFETSVKYILPELKLRLNPLVTTNDQSACKVLCFSEDDPNYFGYESSRMWTSYGGNHKGICLEFDKNEFINENNPSDEFCSIKKSLKNIYLGIDFEDENLQAIISLYPYADIYKLKFHETRMVAKTVYGGN
jgi:hypothetical protein